MQNAQTALEESMEKSPVRTYSQIKHNTKKDA